MNQSPPDGQEKTQIFPALQKANSQVCLNLRVRGTPFKGQAQQQKSMFIRSHEMTLHQKGNLELAQCVQSNGMGKKFIGVR